MKDLEKKIYISIPVLVHSESVKILKTIFVCVVHRYLRLPIPEADLMQENSDPRLSTLKAYPTPESKSDVIRMLGDQTGTKVRVFQDFGPEDKIKTLAVGK